MAANHRRTTSGEEVAQSVLLSYLYGYNVEVDYKEAFKLISGGLRWGRIY